MHTFCIHGRDPGKRSNSLKWPKPAPTYHPQVKTKEVAWMGLGGVGAGGGGGGEVMLLRDRTTKRKKQGCYADLNACLLHHCYKFLKI